MNSLRARWISVAIFWALALGLAAAAEPAPKGAPATPSMFGPAVTDYGSIQDAIDHNPGKMVFVPAGDYVVDRAVRITHAKSGLWGMGRIIQSNPDTAIVQIEGAPEAQVRDLILTRAEGKQETYQAGLQVSKCPNAVIHGVSVLDNWSDRASILIDACPGVQVRDCVIRNYARIAIDDRTKAATNSGVVFGYAFKCINGTGMNVVNTVGALIKGNRISEMRLLPTPELKEKYQLGKFVKKNAERHPLVSQEVWDAEYVNIWRQGAALHIGNGKTSDYIQILDNYIENAQQGVDIQADHVIVANNVVNDAAHGMKATHGARNTLIVGNQFSKNDLWGIGLMAGLAAHVAGQLPNRGPSPVVANLTGYSIITHNIISDFGAGLSHWIWPAADHIGPAPIQLGGNGLADTPPLTDVLIDGNLVYDPGHDKVLVNGKPEVQPPRYLYTIRLQGGAQTPKNLVFSNNLFDPGTAGERKTDAAESSNSDK